MQTLVCYCNKKTSDGIVSMCHLHLLLVTVDGETIPPATAATARLQTQQEIDASVHAVQRTIRAERRERKLEQRRARYTKRERE